MGRNLPVIKGTSALTDKDHGYKQFMEKMRGLSEYTGKVGIQGSDAEKQPYEGEAITLVAVGSIHEFGVPEEGIAERSFLRSTQDINQEKYRKMLKDGAIDVLVKPNVRAPQVLFKVCETCRTDVIGRIRTNQIMPADSPGTIARKGSSTTLVDDGFLVGGITTKVEKAALQAEVIGIDKGPSG